MAAADALIAARLSLDPMRRLVQLERVRMVAAGLQRNAVLEARERGDSWAAIGNVLGVSKQAAQQRYGA